MSSYVLTVTLPIFLGIGLGYIAVFSKWFQANEIKALGHYTVLIGVPALMFRGLSRQSLSSVFNPDFLAVYALGSFSAMAVVTLVARIARGRSLSQAGLQGLGASVSNSMFVGYPIVVQVLGPAASVALALCVLVENILVIPVGLAMADSDGVEGHSVSSAVASTFRSVLRNPMIISIALGLTFSALNLHLPEVIDKSLSLVASSTSPIALFVIGGSLVGLRMDGMRMDVGLIVLSKLILHPLCVLVWVLLFPPTEPLLRSAAVLFAAMPMMGIYPVLAHRYGQEKLCSAALLGATAVSFFTISTAITLLPIGWLPVR